MDNQHSNLDQVFGALSDTTRRAIIMRLCVGEASVGELARPFQMALPSFMKHIGVLEGCGLISTQKSGRVRSCVLQEEAMETIETWLASQREVWAQRLDRLEIYVEHMKQADPNNAQ